MKGNEIATFEDEQVMKGLECCVVRNIDCISCPYYEKAYCVEVDALDLIKRQKAEIRQKDIEIDMLIRKKKSLRDEISELQAEIERLADRNYKCIYLSDDETTEFCVDAICPKYKTEK